MKMLAGALALALVSSAHAQILNTVTSLERIDRPNGAPDTIAKAVASLPRYHAAVIGLDSHDTAFIIPISGNTAGGGGTYFRSDVAIANYRGLTQRIGVGFMAQGQNNTNAALQYFTVPANSVAAISDFVGTTLGKTGLGALFIEGVDSAGNADASASLDGFSRIWTPQPGSAGSVSQNFDAVTLTDSLGSLTAYIIGLRQNSSFRTNVGVVNLDTAAHTWTIRSTVTGASSTMTVQPFSVSQGSAAAGSGDSSGNVVLTLNSDGFGFYWTAYGSSTDNVTGDGWVARAKQ